ncbi:DUF2752 domain-containing protein [Mucilaginibacter sp. X4EP1]|uniref:DUF2752 domain-containing protein n=1 Tax=Mucilaginibacter sp. X4EP1 TaxID=2723092 RepID=UPI00216945EF|nr:DUF2752 domain-containing protein [Mucilaginibacter sp. X4EP1]MCS3813943.1 hypothetical protein [Mucilaginibacter sp. X4EP1]
MFQKKNLYFAAALILITILGVVYYKYDPAKYGFFPKCPFYVITGLDCPGCGSQRALSSLLHGHLKQAIGYNLLMVICLPFLAVHFGYKTASILSKKDIRWEILYNPLTPKILFCVVTIFWITRNIPLYPFSCLSAGH